MKQYLDLMREVLIAGTDKSDRTGTGTRSVFGYQMRFDLSQGFPLVTTKKVHLKSVIHELLWFLSGDTNIGYLQGNGVKIWDAWADESGDLGPVYGKQWRSWPVGAGLGIDQISNVLHLLQNDPDSRRIIVSAWNPADIPDMALAPCHALFQFYTSELTMRERLLVYGVRPEKIDYLIERERLSRGFKEHIAAAMSERAVPTRKLSCQLYQRSADIFLGVPFNIASYALLTHMVAQQVGMAVGDFIWTGGDCHLYENHNEQANLQLSRQPYSLPKLNIKRKPDSLFDYLLEDFEIVGYECHPAIKAEVAV